MKRTAAIRVTMGLFMASTMRLASKITPAEAQNNSTTIIVTYGLGADDNHQSKAGRARVQIHILRILTERVNVANGGTRIATHVTPLPISLTVKGHSRSPHV